MCRGLVARVVSVNVVRECLHFMFDQWKKEDLNNVLVKPISDVV